MKKKKTVADYPHLVKEWHPTLNKLRAEDVTYKSNKKVWWICSRNRDHVWEAIVHSRTRGNCCPFCSGHKVNFTNCLATVNKSLASEWHPTKNGQLKPTDVTGSSNKKVWWECKKEKRHIWLASVNNRTNGNGCPYCSNKKACKDNCLATLNKKLSSEWHLTKNGKLKPTDVTISSDKKAWWICKNNNLHVWKSRVKDRTRGSGCPFCNISKGEEKIERFLKLHKIKYKREKRFKDCKNKQMLPFDFYLPEINCLIEYNGEQHYKPIRFSANWDLEKAKEELKIRKQHDRIKKAWAKKKGIRLIIIKYTDFDSIEFILKELV